MENIGRIKYQQIQLFTLFGGEKFKQMDIKYSIHLRENTGNLPNSPMFYLIFSTIQFILHGVYQKQRNFDGLKFGELVKN